MSEIKQLAVGRVQLIQLNVLYDYGQFCVALVLVWYSQTNYSWPISTLNIYFIKTWKCDHSESQNVCELKKKESGVMNRKVNKLN